MQSQEIVLSAWLWLKHPAWWRQASVHFQCHSSSLLLFRNEAGNLSFNFSHSLCRRFLLWRDKLIRIWNVSLDWELAGIGDDNRFENRSLIHSRDLSCNTLCLFLDVVSFSRRQILFKILVKYLRQEHILESRGKCCPEGRRLLPFSPSRHHHQHDYQHWSSLTTESRHKHISRFLSVFTV